MQPTVKAALLADYALTSQDGKLSVLGIFGNVNFPSLPNSLPRFFVVFVLSLDSGDHNLRLGMLDPSGQQLLPDPPVATVSVDVAGADTNLVVDFNNLPFERAGIYQLQLLYEGRLLHTIPLPIQSIGGVPGMTPGRA